MIQNRMSSSSPRHRLGIKKRGGKNQNKEIFGNIGLNVGQSEPVGTCGKQVKRSFSLSIRYVARLARACPEYRPILRRKLL